MSFSMSLMEPKYPGAENSPSSSAALPHKTGAAAREEEPLCPDLNKKRILGKSVENSCFLFDFIIILNFSGHKLHILEELTDCQDV